jgi:hypothetical protein
MLLLADIRTRGVLLLTLLQAFSLLTVAQSQVKDNVLPLLTTAWGQDAPYNQQCPEKPDEQGTPRHCRVGCVACAMGQVMNYHQYPTVGTGTGTNMFNTSLTVNYGATYYAWADMLDSYATAYTPAQAEAVSTLLFHCGVAVNMIYGLQSSSTFTAFANNMTTALSRYFGYDATTLRSVSRSKYTKTEWLQLIREELSAGRPIIYSGNSDTMGGHTWVIDGYDAAGRVHMNWGWLGRSDGYYDIDLDVPGLDFNRQQSMVIGIQPQSGHVGIATWKHHVSTAVYDLYGRRVRPTAAGLYVRDGKKMVINKRR